MTKWYTYNFFNY